MEWTEAPRPGLRVTEFCYTSDNRRGGVGWPRTHIATLLATARNVIYVPPIILRQNFLHPLLFWETNLESFVVKSRIRKEHLFPAPS